MTPMDVPTWVLDHRDSRCMCGRCGAAPIQESDGHFRGCARLGKCHCATVAARYVASYWSPEKAEEALRRERDPFFCEHSERPEACLPCAQKEKKP